MLKTLSSKQSAILYLILLSGLIYLVVFIKLDAFPFRLWDESMFAVNAYEMSENGNFMVPYCDGEIDWLNTKPLLLTWIQVGFINLFGFNELAVRLPSAFACALSILLVFSFCKKYFSVFYGWLAALILLTSEGYITYHSARTGDSDSLLSFFILAHLLFWLKWLFEKKDKYIFWSFCFLALAVMTKSFAACIFSPAMLLISLFHFRHELKMRIFKSPFFYFGILVLMASLIMVFVVREHFQPGYLKAIFQFDAGRYITSFNLQQQGWDYYLIHIFYDRFVYYTVPFFVAALLILFDKKENKRILHYVLILIVSYLVILSIGSTKMLWYDLPVYPLLAVISAYALVELFSRIELKPFMIIITLIFAFFVPYRQAFFRSQNNPFSPGDVKEECASIYLHNQIKNNTASDLTVYHHGYNGALLCYKYMYAEKGKELEIKHTSDFNVSEKIFVSNDSLKDVLNELYFIDTLEIFNNAIICNIVSKKH